MRRVRRYAQARRCDPPELFEAPLSEMTALRNKGGADDKKPIQRRAKRLGRHGVRQASYRYCRDGELRIVSAKPPRVPGACLGAGATRPHESQQGGLCAGRQYGAHLSHGDACWHAVQSAGRAYLKENRTQPLRKIYRPIMSNPNFPARCVADNSSGSLPAVRNVWRHSVRIFHVGTGQRAHLRCPIYECRPLPLAIKPISFLLCFVGVCRQSCVATPIPGTRSAPSNRPPQRGGQ